jgi:hypothetical protein
MFSSLIILSFFVLLESGDYYIPNLILGLRELNLSGEPFLNADYSD